ncbi:MAG: hypothetical protein JF619_16270, partial [Massilia sp.]|nr:hypothetical protein [Massilia sp.]
MRPTPGHTGAGATSPQRSTGVANAGDIKNNGDYMLKHFAGAALVATTALAS